VTERKLIDGCKVRYKPYSILWLALGLTNHSLSLDEDQNMLGNNLRR